MSEVVAPAPRAHFPWRLRLLIAAAVLVTGLTVFGAIEAMHYSSSTTKLAMNDGSGFFVPKSTTPVAFSLPPLSASGKGPKTTMSGLLGKPLVLNMWASYCTVCRSETPAIESVAKAEAGRVSFLGVDSTDEHGPGLAFVHKYGVSYPQLFDPAGIVATGYGIPGLPVTVFVSASGKVVGENIGALSVMSLDHYLSVLFKK